MQPLKINSALFFTVVFWASAFVGIRVGLGSYSPGALALFRFIIASACMVLISYFLPNRKKVLWFDRLQLVLLGIGAIGLYNICLNYGEVTVTAGVASFVIGLIPVFTVLLSIIFLHERPRIVVYFGIIISLLGLLLMALAEGVDTPLDRGVFIILIASSMGAIDTVIQKRYLIRYHPITVTAWVIWGGTLSLLFFAPELWRDIKIAKTDATIAAVYLGVFPGALAYVAWSFVLNYLPASKASMYLYILPIISTLMGYLFLNEHPAILSLTGGVIAMAGAICAARWSRAPLTYTD